MEQAREQQMWGAIRRQVRRALRAPAREAPLDGNERAHLLPALRQQLQRFTVERESAGQTLLDDDVAVAAYLAYYGVRSFALATIVARAYAVDGNDVLELGAGPGSAGAAVVAASPTARWRVVEPARRAIAVASMLAQELGLPSPTLVATDVRALITRPQGARTVLVFFTVNEWPVSLDERADVLMAVLGGMPVDGRLVVVEPAGRQVARELSALRDRVLARGAVVLGPCTHQQTCPMLERRRDFCHGRVRLELPEDFVALGREAANLDLADTDLATLVLAPSGVALHGAHRVVGDVLREKGRDRLFVCGRGQLVELSVQTGRRHRDATWLRSLGRGDVVALDPAPAGAVHRLTEAAAVRRKGWLP